MAKALYIAEKPSVAREFAAALGIKGRSGDGFIESETAVVTWCVGHLVTMSYPEAYDLKYKRWSLETLPFLPEEFRYEVIDGVRKQFEIVSGLLNRADVDTIYVCTDSGREGEYIYRLVAQMAGVHGKVQKRVWIDSQTEEEIHRGIREAKDLSAYDHLADSAYLRAKEDYLMGINFSRVLTLEYGSAVSACLRTDRTVISVGRVMTCVLGMAVRREREIREFVKTPFYRVIGSFGQEPFLLEGEWRAVSGSRYFEHPCLYRENGFKKREDAEALIAWIRDGGVRPAAEDPGPAGTARAAENPAQTGTMRAAENPGPAGTARAAAGSEPVRARIVSATKKKETKNPPLLYNLAELQNDCSRFFRISPDQTLAAVQELYEKKLVTYPRTDARVLSTAVAKEIRKNLEGLSHCEPFAVFACEILQSGSFQKIAGTRYVNDKQITDHYAIIPTGQGFGALRGVSEIGKKVFPVIVRRFLSIFYPAAVYQKYALELEARGEHFFAGFKVLAEPGYLKVTGLPGKKGGSGREQPPEEKQNGAQAKEPPADASEQVIDASHPDFIRMLEMLKKGMELPVSDLSVREGETSPPKRYSSGSMILAMENAGQLIEDEELRAQIKGSGIGTSATRAEILKKLFHIRYLALNQKTQIITPTLLGELIYEVVNASMRQLLNPELTASWEKGLTYVAEGTITPDEYMQKLEHFIRARTYQALHGAGRAALRPAFEAVAACYPDSGKTPGMRAAAGEAGNGKTPGMRAAAGKAGNGKALGMRAAAGGARNGKAPGGRAAAGTKKTAGT